jgi:hypothetical protein
VTRKTKIRFVLAFILLAVLVTAFWPREDEGEVKITFAGVSPDDSNHVLFTVTNSFKNKVDLLIEPRFQSNSVWQERDGSVVTRLETLHGESATTIDYPIFGTNRWQMIIDYGDSIEISWTMRTRVTVADYAWRHNWQRLGQWLYPKQKFDAIYGPEMLGNKPVSPASK